MAALPCPRASTAGGRALGGGGWVLRGEEVRFSTRRIFPARACSLGCASRWMRVRFPAHPGDAVHRSLTQPSSLVRRARLLGVVSSYVGGAYGCAAEVTGVGGR